MTDAPDIAMTDDPITAAEVEAAKARPYTAPDLETLNRLEALTARAERLAGALEVARSVIAQLGVDRRQYAPQIDAALAERDEAERDEAFESIKATTSYAEMVVAERDDARKNFQHAVAIASEAKAERDAARATAERLAAALRFEANVAGKSTNIMRDGDRTGGWEGAERVARQFERAKTRMEAALADYDRDRASWGDAAHPAPALCPYDSALDECDEDCACASAAGARVKALTEPLQRSGWIFHRNGTLTCPDCARRRGKK